MQKKKRAFIHKGTIEKNKVAEFKTLDDYETMVADLEKVKKEFNKFSIKYHKNINGFLITRSDEGCWCLKSAIINGTLLAHIKP